MGEFIQIDKIWSTLPHFTPRWHSLRLRESFVKAKFGQTIPLNLLNLKVKKTSGWKVVENGSRWHESDEKRHLEQKITH